MMEDTIDEHLRAEREDLAKKEAIVQSFIVSFSFVVFIDSSVLYFILQSGQGLIFGLFPVYFRLKHVFKFIFRRFRPFSTIIYRKQGDLYHFMDDLCPENRHFPKIFAARLGGGYRSRAGCSFFRQVGRFGGLSPSPYHTYGSNILGDLYS